MGNVSFVTLAAKIGFAAMVTFAGAAGAAEIKVMSSIAIKDPYLELLPTFEKSTGHKVTTIWAGTVDIMKRISGGEVVDLVIVAAPTLDELTKQGRIAPGALPLARSGVGAGVKAGATKPDISSAAALKATLLAAKSIGYSTGPSGVYIAELIQRMGIADQVKSKIVLAGPGLSVGDFIARGEAEIGFQQVSELLAVKGIDLVGPLSPDVQLITVFPAGLTTAAPSPDAAKALVAFLRTEEAGAAFARAGMQPK